MYQLVQKFRIMSKLKYVTRAFREANFPANFLVKENRGIMGHKLLMKFDVHPQSVQDALI